MTLLIGIEFDTFTCCVWIWGWGGNAACWIEWDTGATEAIGGNWFVLMLSRDLVVAVFIADVVWTELTTIGVAVDACKNECRTLLCVQMGGGVVWGEMNG